MSKADILKKFKERNAVINKRGPLGAFKKNKKRRMENEDKKKEEQVNQQNKKVDREALELMKKEKERQLKKGETVHKNNIGDLT